MVLTTLYPKWVKKGHFWLKMAKIQHNFLSRVNKSTFFGISAPIYIKQTNNMKSKEVYILIFFSKWVKNGHFWSKMAKVSKTVLFWNQHPNLHKVCQSKAKEFDILKQFSKIGKKVNFWPKNCQNGQKLQNITWLWGQ